MRSITKNLLVGSTLLLGVCGFSTANAAQPAFYAGASLSQLKIKFDGASITPKTTTLNVDAGVKLNPYLATEIRLGTGVDDYSHDWSSTDTTTIAQKLTYGLYVKGILPITDIFSVYGLAGYTHGTFQIKETDTSYYSKEDISGSGASYGAGISLNATKQLAVNFEYAHLYKDQDEGDDYKLEGLTLGVNYQF